MKIKLLLLTLACAGVVHAGEVTLQPKEVAPPAQDQWQFNLALPLWATWQTGEYTLQGHTAHVDLGPDDFIPRIDMASDIRFEAHKGRFGVMGEFLYLALSDGIGTKTAVQKMDLQVDQMMADIAVTWRIYESPKASVDVLGGIRYTNYFQQVALQGNDERINQIASQLAAASTAVNITKELSALKGSDPTVPIAPLDAGAIRKVASAIKHVKGSVAERQEKIASILHNQLDRTVSRLDDWWDPYIGLRGCYNLTNSLYVTAKADIGGFGVGADLTWQAEAALGLMLTKYAYAELGYRAIGLDYQHAGMHMDTITHGIQMTVGLAF